ncbi:MAG: hypothetical protein RIR61_935 [Bacteroidota bacterium]|jgi:hypothetical protein
MKTTLTLIALALGLQAHSQWLPSYGGERAGQAAFSFLKTDYNIASAGMGSVGSVLGGDARSLGYNPAGLARTASSSLTFASMGSGSGLEQGAVFAARKVKSRSAAWGFGLQRLQTGAYEERTEFRPQGTGRLLYDAQTAVTLTYAQQLTQQFQMGVTLKALNESYSAGYAGWGAAADIGFQYFLEDEGLRFAVVLRNFGAPVALKGDYWAVAYNRDSLSALESANLPTEFAIGLHYRVWAQGKHHLDVAAQLVHPNDNAENYRAGLEYRFADQLFVRSGILLNQAGQPFPTLGLGIAQNVGGTRALVDLSVQPTAGMGTWTALSLTLLPATAR